MGGTGDKKMVTREDWIWSFMSKGKQCVMSVLDENSKLPLLQNYTSEPQDTFNKEDPVSSTKTTFIFCDNSPCYFPNRRMFIVLTLFFRFKCVVSTHLSWVDSRTGESKVSR